LLVAQVVVEMYLVSMLALVPVEQAVCVAQLRQLAVVVL
jgi:hypothetical protein